MNSTILTIALGLLATCAAADNIHDPLANGIGGDVITAASSEWTIDDGVLTPRRGEERTYVITKKQYSDVEIAFEFNPESETNSGVFARCQDPEEISPQSCYEFNIWDAHPNQESRTGAIVTISPPVAIVNTEDKWNTMRIALMGDRLQVWVNDILTNDIRHATHTRGHIAFQYGGMDGMVVFRNIRIRELD